MPQPPLIHITLDSVKKEFELDPPMWLSTDLTEHDILFLHEECDKPSPFDPHNRRKKMLDKMIHREARSIIKRCDYGQVFAIFDRWEQEIELPWELWGRILRMYSGTSRKKFKVYFLADDSLREFPKGKEIRPENINGGYTYPCDTKSIVIYRAEDATRVLIHELQHSCCLDNIDKTLDEIEAETEAWAELFYVAILSQGKRYMFKDLLQRQSEWIIKQNRKVKKHMKDPNSIEFPWRYTIGKELVKRNAYTEQVLKNLKQDGGPAERFNTKLKSFFSDSYLHEDETY
jgi:hypothetical protein